uniref:Protein takeout n=1 Tax=Cacopsylla melanoneura TaxID=428564 RepID=A0A8D9BNU7_9HEMI
MVTRAFVCYSRKLILLVSLLTIFEAVDCASKWPSWVKPCRIKDGPVDDCIARRIAEAQPNVINADVTGDFRFDYELIPKKGLNVAKITNSSMTFTVGKAYFDLKNLFNGDKYLGAQMNNFLNENYAEVIREFGPAVGDAFNQVFRSIMQGGFDLVPIETAYPDLGHYPDKP